MENNRFDIKIKDLTVKREEICKEMDDIAKEFVHEAGKFTTAWTKDKIEYYVKNNSQYTKSLGLDKLKELKSECRDLIQEIPSIVQRKLDTPKIWSHKKSLSDFRDVHQLHDFKFSYEHDIQTQIDDSLRQVLGYAGGLLIKYGYTKRHLNDMSDWEKSSSGYKYRYGITWSPEMDEIKQRYLDKNNDLVDILSELKSTKIKKEEGEAEDLWNQV